MATRTIEYNKPHLTGRETRYIQNAVESMHISGNGKYTKLCHKFFHEQYSFPKTFLTTSCTHALEMSALLLEIGHGDEVIMPSYTFVSTANAFILRGAEIKFADSLPDHPNIDPSAIEALITHKTKAIVVVHYAGMACDMDSIMALASKHNIYVVEDAAQAIDNHYKGKALGSIGHLATFSFHETKNITSGEGGMLVVNDERFVKRAEILWEKGTNRAAFFRGEIDKYNWIDVGSSFLPSEVTAAFLYAQLEDLEEIQKNRVARWNKYHELLSPIKDKCELPNIPADSGNNGHIYYIILNSLQQRNELIKYLKEHHVSTVFHYLSLHKSPFFKDKHDGREIPNSDRLSDCLLRLPVHNKMSLEDVEFASQHILTFFENE